MSRRAYGHLPFPDLPAEITRLQNDPQLVSLVKDDLVGYIGALGTDVWLRIGTNYFEYGESYSGGSLSVSNIPS